MEQLKDSGGSSQPRNESKRDVVIRDASRDISDGTITIDEFLNNVTFIENGISLGMVNFYDPSEYVDTEDEEESCDEETTETISLGTTNSTNHTIHDDLLCIVCLVNKANVFFLPCQHLKCCNNCVSELKTDGENDFLCPSCRGTVIQTFTAYI